jgi:ABC-2 type transport system ATP-binding protein
MIQFNSLSFSYSAKLKLFDQLDFSIKPGMIHGLLGKNGSGKTTMLKLVCGLVTPVKGEILTGGFIPSKRQPQFLSDVFLLTEEVYLPTSTAEKLVSLYAPFYPRFDSNQFREMLNQLDVNYQQPLTRLSLGQKKKVMIAFALACNTSYLLLDEPTNGLDIPSKLVFRRLIASVFSADRTIVISTHQVRDLDSLIDNVILLHANKIIVHSSIEQIAAKYQFIHSSTQPEGEILYSCRSVLGQSYMMGNPHSKAGQVDLETFFNAATENSGKSIFSENLF